jgi:hypothetical protein
MRLSERRNLICRPRYMHLMERFEFCFAVRIARCCIRAAAAAAAAVDSLIRTVPGGHLISVGRYSHMIKCGQCGV